VQSVPGSLRVLSRSSVPGHDRSRELRSVTMSGKLRQRRGYLRVTAIDRVQIPIRRSWGRVPKPPHQARRARRQRRRSALAARAAHAGPTRAWHADPRWLNEPRVGRVRGIFFGSRLSSSRPPRLGRPCGPSHAIGCAAPRPGDHSQGSGAYQEDGGGVFGISWVRLVGAVALTGLGIYSLVRAIGSLG
jgi:hypothetical protein